MDNHNVKIIIATHKKYEMPTDPIYLPLHVGAEGKKDTEGKELNLGYVKDNYGTNISNKNSSFCELTGLYWAWKNLRVDYIGLAHYRRHFSARKKSRNPFENVLNSKEIYNLVPRFKVIVPQKRNYYIETLYSHYKHTHHVEQLDETKKIIAEKYPNYIKEYNVVMQRRWAYMFNMMIMERTLLSDYCAWLFDILFELEKRIDTSGLSFYQGRFYGRISELIYNVWLQHQLDMGILRKDDIKELPYIYMESIDWRKKACAFLKSKFLHTKYNSSF
ncbi:DUF4422 domain-containing protein [Enterocloster aldenensis]|uniref:DUF4422 domain-containing protein n=1 Tax=Enterocloster aldenensis TaxID=358742 RepID=UPI000E4AB36D|nr:DUF4422 domain-containing protein [Enterocloster aldenensis]